MTRSLQFAAGQTWHILHFTILTSSFEHIFPAQMELTILSAPEFICSSYFTDYKTKEENKDGDIYIQIRTIKPFPFTNCILVWV